MKAWVYTKYGPPDVLQQQYVDKPEPRENEIRVKVIATTVNRTDCATIQAIPWFARVITGLLKPKKQIPGTEFAGTVDAVGSQVSGLKIGERVFGFNDQGSEAHAQYLTTTTDKATGIPDGVSFEQAAASSEGTHYAYNFINKVDLEPGQKVLVNGATGAIGSAAVQLLKHFGADVTAVCAGKNMDLVKSLGANRTIDYKKEDFTEDGQSYDYVFDTVGKSSFFQCRRLLKPGGVYISSDLGYLAQNIFLPLITPVLKPFLGGRRTVFPVPVNIEASLQLVRSLMREGKFKAMIDKTYPLEDIVDAYHYVIQGHKKGNVVIAVSQDDAS
jgi:NADPH:quinone reductase-like Zn-dependent oxidoreductase